MKKRFAFLGFHVIEDHKHGNKSSIETLINEEALLLGMYLRDERKEWIPRIAIT